MMYETAVVLHVLVAVLLIGLCGAIPVVARAALVGSERILGTLVRALQIGLLAMLLTGVLIDVSVAGAFHATGWFRGSVALWIVVGICVGRTRGALRRGALPRVERWGWITCVAVALVTILMRAKFLP